MKDGKLALTAMIVSLVGIVFSVISLSIFLLGCGQEMSTEEWPPDLYVAGIPVAGDASIDESNALARLSAAISALHFSLQDCPTVIFIRSPDQRVPEMCRDGDCCDVWKECPYALGTPERVPGEGYSGLQRGGMIFISRIGSRASALDELLAHEFAHFFCDCDDGSEVNGLEKRLLDEM